MVEYYEITIYSKEPIVHSTINTMTYLYYMVKYVLWTAWNLKLIVR